MAPSLPTEVPVASTSITAIPEPAVAATSSPAVASSFMTSPGAVAATAAGTLSKSAAKRLAKQAIWEETKGARRQREKERKAARKAAVLEQIAAGDTELEASQRERAERQREKNNLKHRFDWKASPATGLKAPKSEAEWFQARCVVDLGFDELMMEKEVKSMASQLGYLWNIQRTAAKPFRSLVFTHLDQRLGQNLEASIWSKANGRWQTTEWWDGRDLDDLWKEAAAPQTTAPLTTDVQANVEVDSSRPLPSSLDGSTISRVRELPSRSAPDNVIYLTADSPNEVATLEAGVTYVIGGIVDKNRYKSLCLNKAHKLGVRTARLPIGQYLADMPTRKVLTVNQVYEILTTWIETRDWETAFRRVIPLRKFTEGHANAKKKQKLVHGSAGDDEPTTFLEQSEDEEGDIESPESEAIPSTEATPVTLDTTRPPATEDEEAALNR